MKKFVLVIKDLCEIDSAAECGKIHELIPGATDIKLEDGKISFLVPDTFETSDSVRGQLGNYDIITEEIPEIITPKYKKVSVYALLISVIAAILATAILTLSLTSAHYGKQITELKSEAAETVPADELTEDTYLTTQLKILDSLFEAQYYFYGDVNKEELTENLMKAYVALIGDEYGQYYTPEEYAKFITSNSGSNVGIGVSFEQTQLTVDSVTYDVFKVQAVFKNSPAYLAGLQIGDCIAYIGRGAEKISITSLGYNAAVEKMRGEKDTYSEFSLYRQTSDGYELLDFSIKRSDYTVDSVEGRVYSADSSVGIVTISQFQYNTPKQFRETVDGLLEIGCTSFVFDVRNNPGGAVRSVQTILSFFLNEGDLVLSTENAQGTTGEYLATAYEGSGDFAGCSISKDQIGIYKNLKCIVLTNEYTASAAELFTATLRDYGIAKSVGTKTYGKGCMQNTFSTASYGIPGGIKLTTAMYFSKSHTVYHEIGIYPDIEIELSEAARQKNFYKLEDSEDNQLQTAIGELKK